MSLDPNAVLLARRLKQAGYSNANIAGILGNFQLESGFNPRVNEGGVVGAPAGKGGYGFGQWTGGRQTNLIDFARQRKKDPGDPNLQADFLLHELGGPEKSAADYLRQAQSPEESARRFVTGYERAGIPKTEQRQQAARAIFGKLGFLDQTGTPPGTGQRSVEDILSGALTGQPKPGVEEKKSIADSIREAALQSVMGMLKPPSITLPTLINPFTSQ